MGGKEGGRVGEREGRKEGGWEREGGRGEGVGVSHCCSEHTTLHTDWLLGSTELGWFLGSHHNLLPVQEEKVSSKPTHTGRGHPQYLSSGGTLHPPPYTLAGLYFFGSGKTEVRYVHLYVHVHVYVHISTLAGGGCG